MMPELYIDYINSEEGKEIRKKDVIIYESRKWGELVVGFQVKDGEYVYIPVEYKGDICTLKAKEKRLEKKFDYLFNLFPNQVAKELERIKKIRRKRREIKREKAA